MFGFTLAAINCMALVSFYERFMWTLLYHIAMPLGLPRPPPGGMGASNHTANKDMGIPTRSHNSRDFVENP